MSQPPLVLHYGGGDMLEAVDDLRRQILDGKIVGVVIAAATTDSTCGWWWAWKDYEPYVWARMLAAVASAHAELVNQGL